jgi:phenylacetate-CoA ligase
MTSSSVNWLGLESCSEHLGFPAFFDPSAGPVVAYLAQLGQTQSMPGAEMFRRQLKQLSLRMQHARRHSSHFGPLLADVDFTDPKAVFQAFQALPILTRGKLQGEPEAIYTQPPPRHGKIEEKLTSGSTGQSVTVRTTAATFALRAAQSLRGHQWQGLDFNHRMAALRAQVKDAQGNPTISEKGRWGGGVFASGPSGAMSSALPVQAQLDWLKTFNPAYLLVYPSNLAELIKAGPAGKPQALTRVLTLGETVSPELREMTQAAWGVSISDRYSSEELGMIAIECHHGLYHLMSESLIVEILTEDDRPCQAGEVGRVVATDLHNFATALLRYDTRDYAEVGPPCTCGLRLPTLKRIMGRTRNMLRLPGGQSLWPTFGLRQPGEWVPIKQFQVIQTHLDQLEVRLHVPRPFTEAEESALRQRIVQRLAPHAFSIRFIYFDQPLTQGPNGKFEEFICSIQA